MRKLLVILSLFILANVAHGQTSVAKAQAMFIYNFARLIAWPAEYQSGNFVIGILGTSNLESELENYCSSKKIGFQSITVKKFKDPEEITKCHIIFVTYGKSGKLSEVVSKVSQNSTLIVTEKRGVISEGSAINFIIGEDKLKFEMKVENASKYGLKISSRLQDMAILVP